MSDEAALSAMGAAERDAQTIPERWRRLAEGEASPQEIAELEREAEQDEQAALLWARFRPLDSDDEARIAEAMSATRPARRSAPRALGLGLAAAAAAAVAVWVAPADGLPPYALEASTPDLPHRGAPAADPELPRHHPGSAVTLVLRPDAPVSTPVAVQSFAVAVDEVRPVTAVWEVSERGAARLDARVETLLPGHRGPATLLFLLRSARADPVSADATRAALARGRPPQGTRWLRYRLQVVRD